MQAPIFHGLAQPAKESGRAGATSGRGGPPVVVAITGASGFLGRHLTRDLHGRSGASLRLLARSPRVSSPPAGDVEIVDGDLRDPEAALALVTPGAIVVNLAYLAAGSGADNLAMAENLAAACDRAGAARLLHCSTAVVAGNAGRSIVTETTPCRPATAYQRIKLDIEGLLQDRLQGRCPLTIVRPTAILGPGGTSLVGWAAGVTRGSRWYNRAKAALLANRRTHLVCVENAVASFSFLMSRDDPATEGCFIVSDDEDPANNGREVMRILAEELGRSPIPQSDPGLPPLLAGWLLRLGGRPVDDSRRIYSSGKLMGLGFHKPMDLEEGIRRFARAYAESTASR
jgi:nucleoside-diphosphate-sugar epimerase